MEEKHIEEIQRIIESSQDGNWIPTAIVATLGGVICLLAGIIVRIKLKQNDKRHEAHDQRHKDSEGNIDILTKVSVENQLLLKEYGVKIQNIENVIN